MRKLVALMMVALLAGAMALAVAGCGGQPAEQAPPAETMPPAEAPAMPDTAMADTAAVGH